MNDRQIMQWAFDALSQGYEGGRLHDVLAVLHDRLAEPPCKAGASCTNKCEQCSVREWINLSAADIKLMRRASTNDRQFAEMIQAKLRNKNS